MALGLEVPIQLRNMFESRKVRPICKKFGFVKYFSLCTSSKMLNLCKVYLAQFLTFLGVLGLFRKLKMSSKQIFLLTFKRTCNVLIHNFQMKHFLPKLVRHEVVENLILFKMTCGGKISDKVCESYAWSKFC